jgi:hypothetical protein
MSAATNTSTEWVKSMAASLRDEDCGPAARLIEALATERDALAISLAAKEAAAQSALNDAWAERDRLAGNVARLRKALEKTQALARRPAGGWLDGQHSELLSMIRGVVDAALGDTP